MQQHEAGFALKRLTLLPDSFRNATFRDVWRYDGWHCDMWPAPKGWNVAFLNRLRHERREVENTAFVNRQPGAEERWEKKWFVFCTLVREVCGGVATRPSSDLILREAFIVTRLQTKGPTFSDN